MPILSTLLKFAAVLVMFFTGSVALIRTQPYAVPDLRTVSASAACVAPCFMGIHPGVTTGYDALELLRTNRWVRYIQNINVATGSRSFSGSISWEWSGRQPAWIDVADDSWIWTDENRVEYIAIHTNIRLGDIWLAYGAPIGGTVYDDPGARLPSIAYEAVYPRQNMFVTVRGACPFHNYWSETTLITFRDDMPSRLSASQGGSGLHRSITSQCAELLN